MRIVSRILLSFLLLVFISPIHAQDTNYARYVISQMTSNAFHGRGYSYRGDSISAAFIRSELKKFHLNPLGDDYYQTFSFSTTSMEGPLLFRVDDKILIPFDDYRVAPFSHSLYGEFNLLSISPEVLLNPSTLKTFLKKKNQLLSDVLIYVDVSHLSDRFSDDDCKKISRSLNELKLRNPFNSKGIIVGLDQLSTYSPAHADIEHDYTYIEVLASKLPKRPKKVRCGIYTQFHPHYVTQNVCAFVPGETDTMIVYTAHYDHLGLMGDSVMFPGAHDNASGVAAVLDLARMTMQEQPHYTTVFCFFSGEESGLKGSRYAAEHPLFDFSKVRLLVNIDLFCGGKEGLMIFNADAPEVEPFVERMELLNSLLEIAPEIRRRSNAPNSDHFFFVPHMPALFILTMGQPYGGYHDTRDDCSHCGLQYYLNYLTLISAIGL